MSRPATHAGLEHERVVMATGRRSALTVLVALHSTARGPALGGCRVWRYAGWRDALDDVLRLSAGMTAKTAASGLAFGGGKAVVALPPGTPQAAVPRREVMLDVGDVVASLDGAYLTGPDVGTGPADMAIIAERTDRVLCTPAGSGDSAPATARATLHCLRETARHLHGHDDLAGRSVVLVGLGHVGELLAGELAAAGARLTVSDVDPGRRSVATRLGAGWVEPDRALREPAEFVVPAALGGALTPESVAQLRCTAVVGPANDQLADDGVADALFARGVLWAPDYLVSAGGVVHAVAAEIDRVDPEESARRLRGPAATWGSILARADRDGVGPHRIARRLVETRLAEATLGHPVEPTV